MQLDVYIHSGSDASPPKWAVELKDMLTKLTQKETLMGQEFDNLTAQVTASTTVQDSVITLLGGIKTQLDAALAQIAADGGTPPAALQALADSLSNETTKMAAAITANTPAASGGSGAPPPGGGPAPAAAQRR